MGTDEDAAKREAAIERLAEGLGLDVEPSTWAEMRAAWQADRDAEDAWFAETLAKVTLEVNEDLHASGVLPEHLEVTYDDTTLI